MTQTKPIIIDPDLSERELDGYYVQRFYCTNCHDPIHLNIASVDVMILKGKPRPKKLMCPNCETENLE